MNKLDNKNQLTASIIPKAVFGIRKTDLYQNVIFYSAERVAYIAGNYIVITSVKEKNQFFIPALKNCSEMTAFAIDEFKDSVYVVFAQKFSKGPTLAFKIFKQSPEIFNFEESFTYPILMSDLEKHNITSLAVKALNGFIFALATQSTGSCVVVYQYDIRQNKVGLNQIINLSDSSKTKHLNLNKDSNIISLISEGSFSFYQVFENDKKKFNKCEVSSSTLKSFPEFAKATLNMVSSCWINKNRHACINDMGDVFIIDFSNTAKNKNFETPQHKLIRAGQVFEMQTKPKWIFSRNKCIYVSKDDGAIQKLEEKSGDKNNLNYERVSTNPKFVQNLPKMEVHCISLSACENPNAIVISSESSQLYYVDIQSDKSLDDGNNYKHFICNFHSEEIISLDVARMKPLVATCSKDRYIRIWNYINIQLESELLDDEPTALSFHPNGLHLAVAFLNKYKLMHVLEKTILTYKEVNLFNHILDIKFSNYGHLLGITYKSTFQIINFYSGESVYDAKPTEGHTQEVTCLTWNSDDTGFATCGNDGKAFYWQLNNKEEKFLIKCSETGRESKYFGVEIASSNDPKNSEGNASGEETKKLIVGTENEIYELANVDKCTLRYRDDKAIANKENSMFSQIKYDQESKYLIIASKNHHLPTIKIGKYVAGSNIDTMYSFQANSLGVNALRISNDMTHLFTAGKDHCLFIFQFQNIQKNDKRDDNLETDLILVKKEELDKEIFELRTKLLKFEREKELEEENFKKQEADIDFKISVARKNLESEKLKFSELEEGLDFKIKILKENYENEKEEIEKDFIRKNELLDQEQIETTEAKKKEIKEQEANFNIEKGKDDKSIQDLKTTQENQKEEYIKKKEDEKKKLQEERDKLEEDLKILNQEISDKKQKLFENNDNTVFELRKTLEGLRIEYFNNEAKFKEEKNKYDDEIENLKKNIKEKVTKKKKASNEVEDKKKKNEILKKAIDDHINEINEKNNTIVEKKRIKLELEKENQELEKFKFVLNYKIRELKSEKQPKENKLSVLEKQKKDMEREIKNFEFAQENYIINLTKNHQTLQLHEKQIAELEKRISESKKYKAIFQEQFYNLKKKCKTLKDTKLMLVTLKRLFLDKDVITNIEKPYESNYESQRQFLEKNKIDSNTKITDSQLLFNQDHKKLMKENMNLIKIINDLEREHKEIKEKRPEDFNKPKEKVEKDKKIMKENLPKFSKGKESVEQTEMKIKEEILEIEKKIQSKKYEAKENKERKERKNIPNHNFNDEEDEDSENIYNNK